MQFLSIALKRKIFKRVWLRRLYHRLRYSFLKFPRPLPIPISDEFIEEGNVGFLRRRSSLLDFPVGLHIDKCSGIPHWRIYKRFFEYNKIPYRTFDLLCRDWRSQVDGIKIFVGRPPVDPVELAVFRESLYFLEKHMAIKCFPSFQSCLLYENKWLQYIYLNSLGFPVIPTTRLLSFDEGLKFFETCSFPCVLKANHGASSSSVFLVKSRKKGIWFLKKIFSDRGLVYSSYANAVRGVCLIQPFIENRGFDLRVVVCGTSIVGYFRDQSGADFRASGAGKLRFGHLPVEAMLIARRISQSLEIQSLAVDFLETLDGDYVVIEVSQFIGHKTCMPLRVGGKAGRYDFDGERFTFVEGRFWHHELMLIAFFDSLFN